jgi:hypothetical protein
VIADLSVTRQVPVEGGQTHWSTWKFHVIILGVMTSCFIGMPKTKFEHTRGESASQLITHKIKEWSVTERQAVSVKEGGDLPNISCGWPVT